MCKQAKHLLQSILFINIALVLKCYLNCEKKKIHFSAESPTPIVYKPHHRIPDKSILNIAIRNQYQIHLNKFLTCYN